MNFFKAVKIINILYVVGIVAITIYNNIIFGNPNFEWKVKLVVILAVLFISIPNLLAAGAVSPRLRLAKTTIVINVICILLFGAGLSAYEQERLAIHWAIAVISICTLNVAALISALARKRKFHSESEGVVYP